MGARACNDHCMLSVLPSTSELSRAHFVECGGEPYAMGRQQGETQREVLAGLLDAALASLGSGAGSATGRLPALLWKALDGPTGALVAQFRGRLEAQFANQCERLRGIAEGAGIPVTRFYFALAAGLWLETTVAPVGGVAFAIEKARSSGGVLLARNVDARVFLKGATQVRASHPSRGYGSIEFGFVNEPGSHVGLNEAGLAVSMTSACDPGATRVGVPASWALQEVLERYRTVGEAVAYLSGLSFARPRTFVLGDATGSVALLEVANLATRVRRARDGYVVDANRLQTRVPKVGRATRVDEWVRFALRQRVDAGAAALSREKRLVALLSGTRGISRDDVLKVLRDAGPDDRMGQDTPCVESVTRATIGSVVCFAEGRRMLVATGRPDREEFAAYGF